MGQKKSLVELDTSIEKVNEQIEDLRVQLNEVIELQNKNIGNLIDKIAAIKSVLDEIKEKKDELELEALIDDVVAFRNRLYNKK